MSLFYIIFYILIGLITIAVYFLRKNLNYWKDRGIPHNEPHPLLGNLKGFRKDRILPDLFQVVYDKFKGTGPFCGFFFFLRPAIMVLDTNIAKNILIKDFNNFSNRGIYHNERDDPLTGHLFALDGIKWKQMRTKLSPTFTSGKMKFMFPTIISVAEEFVKVFGDMVKKESVVEVKELLARFTTDVIGTCAFGIECNSLNDPKAEFLVMGRRSFKETRHNNLVMAFIQSFHTLSRFLGFRIVNEDIHQFFMRIVRETVEYREKNNIKRNDFMDLLVKLKNTETITLENGEVLTGLTVEEIAAQAFVFFLAGFETSSTTMGFALYELARNQDIQDKMRQEINDVLGKHNQEFTYECIKDLHYMDQVISETLRLYTVIPHLIRESIDDYEIEGYPKYKIDKGLLVLIPVAAIHSDPEYYPEPKKFDPDRFSPEMVRERDSIKWLAFGDGPRNCIGLRFGQMQSRIGLAHLIKNFKFSVCERTDIPLKFDPMAFVLGVIGGIHLKVERI